MKTLKKKLTSIEIDLNKEKKEEEINSKLENIKNLEDKIKNLEENYKIINDKYEQEKKKNEESQNIIKEKNEQIQLYENNELKNNMDIKENIIKEKDIKINNLIKDIENKQGIEKAKKDSEEKYQKIIGELKENINKINSELISQKKEVEKNIKNKMLISYLEGSIDLYREKYEEEKNINFELKQKIINSNNNKEIRNLLKEIKNLNAKNSELSENLNKKENELNELKKIISK